ncbi:hypothetical protein BMS3Bbin16_00244 [archaeon BMS3Bbin16]|nr:hypothetical protein BMS3Bbin16_00244 [archaeon BMS3Bbin16]
MSHVIGVVTASTNVTVALIPRALFVSFDTPKKLQSPRNITRMKLFKKTPCMKTEKSVVTADASFQYV